MLKNIEPKMSDFEYQYILLKQTCSIVQRSYKKLSKS